MKLLKYLTIAMLVILSSCNSIPSRNFEFNYKVNLSSNNGKVMDVWIPIPQSNDLQTVNNLVIETDVAYALKTELLYGNKYLYAHLEQGLREDKVIDIRFKVKRLQAGRTKAKMDNIDRDLKANRLVSVNGKFDSIVNVQQFNPEKMYDVYNFVLNEMYYGKPKLANETDAYYASLPNEIKAGISKDSVVALYQSTINNKGEFTFGNGNSDYACDISVGNCTDFHSYFISLARTMKVPANFHIGFSIPDAKKGDIGGYHCWADFLENNYWVPVDISEADKNAEKADFYYSNLDANRVEFTQGRDLILEGYENGPVNFFIYPIILSDNQPFVFSKSFSFKEI